MALVPNRSAQATHLLEFYTRIITKVVDADRCSVFINDPERGKIWLKAGTGLAEHEIEVPTEGSTVGKVIQSGQPLILSGMDQKEGAHKKTDTQTGFVTHNVLCVPISSPHQAEVIGAIQVLNKKNNQEFNDEDVETLKEIADHLRDEVSTVFLNQEIYGLSEKIYNSTRRLVSFVIGGIVVGLALLFIAIFAYVVIPALGG